MGVKKIDARIVLKHDTEAHWLLAENFIPLAGEVIVYDVDENYNYERQKIGDGVTTVNELPFQCELATEDEVLDALILADALPIVTDENGSVLTDENSNILLV